MDPTIIFEDDALMVINKPSGMTVNRSDTTRDQRTVQDWVEKYLEVSKDGKVSKVSSGEDSTPFDTSGTSLPFDTFLSRAGIVHRLDKETSGILLVAKTPEAFVTLQGQFKERKVKKTYIALAHGKMEQETGEISVPVGRLPWNRKQFGVVAGGREALTKYKVIHNYTLYAIPYTLLELYPETGRTHQIRVHLKHVGHAIFGDFLYAGRKTAKNDRKVLPRVFLHAAKISFFHPTTGEEVSFEAPLTSDLQKLLSTLSQ